MHNELDVTIRPALRQDIPAMAAVLGRAFLEDDPLGAFLFPDTDQRRTRQVKMMSVLIKRRFIPQHGAEVAVVDGEVVGVCLWHGPHSRRTPWHTFISGPELIWAMRSRVRAGIALDARFAKIAPGVPHLFGVYLGCDPHLQNRGVGAALVRSFLGKADTESVPVIGVCKNDNVPFYQAYGCGLFGRTAIGKNGPVANVMLKLPSTATVSPRETMRTAL